MTNSLLSTAASLAFLLCAAGLPAQEPAPPPSEAPAVASVQQESASPGVRIVRLSQAVGEVQLDRQTGRGFEKAFANLPITQGGKLRTGEGVAEVEFEDNSSLRLTPNSEVDFPVLSLNSGVRSSTIHVSQGTVYVSLARSKGSDVHVTFGHQTLALLPAAHIEVALNGKQPRVDVLDGVVEATSGGTSMTVGRKRALLFDPNNATAPVLISKNEKGQFDDWDKREADYHSHFAASNNYGATPYSYGLADMNYYGGFSMVGNCGMMWQPYLTSANWSPYSNGTWAWYPGAGYSWVSPYPWGWTAYHSGSWNYCQGAGWGWQPSNQWYGLNNAPAAKLPNGQKCPKPPAPPTALAATTVAVNEKPLVHSELNGQNAFVFRKDSAGLGVPRTTFGNLHQISTNVVQHGSVERGVSLPSAGERSSGNSAMSANHTSPSGQSYSSGHSMGSAGNTMGGGHSASSGVSASSGGSFSSGASAGAGGGGHH